MKTIKLSLILVALAGCLSVIGCGSKTEDAAANTPAPTTPSATAPAPTDATATAPGATAPAPPADTSNVGVEQVKPGQMGTR